MKIWENKKLREICILAYSILHSECLPVFRRSRCMVVESIKGDYRYHLGLEKMCSAIWCHLYNLKNMKNTHGGVLLLKVTLPRVFFMFFTLHKWYHITQHTIDHYRLLIKVTVTSRPLQQPLFMLATCNNLSQETAIGACSENHNT